MYLDQLRTYEKLVDTKSGGGANQKVFFSRSIAVLRHKNERNLGMVLQNTVFFCILNDAI